MLTNQWKTSSVSSRATIYKNRFNDPPVRAWDKASVKRTLFSRSICWLLSRVAFLFAKFYVK